MIIVCPLNKAHALIAEHGARHAVSLLSSETPQPVFDALEPDKHLKLTFHDIVQPMDGMTPPRAADAERLVNFLMGWEREAPMLIHCWAGISRSTAAAYTAMCLMRPDESEDELAQELRDASPSATPNRLIVSFTDQLLGRQGRMVRAVEKIGRGADAFEGVPFVVRVG
jgi:predicted protein tyrosine phosphatase